jgi:hypothetical protein
MGISTSQSRPYKIYKADMSQSGGSSPVLITSGSLTFGVTYYISSYDNGDDFTQCGASSNTNDTTYQDTEIISKKLLNISLKLKETKYISLLIKECKQFFIT